MMRHRFLAVAALAAGALLWTGLARAGEDVPAAPAAPKATSAAAETPKVAEAPATKTPSPIWSVLGWVAKQVAPNVECGCPSTAEGEKAWRTWFDGGADVPLAGLRDAMVADGWNADRTISYFKEMSAKKAASGECAQGACADKSKEGCCQGKGERSDGKGCCGGCKKKGEAKVDAPKPDEVPAETPAKP